MNARAHILASLGLHALIVWVALALGQAPTAYVTPGFSPGPETLIEVALTSSPSEAPATDAADPGKVLDAAPAARPSEPGDASPAPPESPAPSAPDETPPPQDQTPISPRKSAEVAPSPKPPKASARSPRIDRPAPSARGDGQTPAAGTALPTGQTEGRTGSEVGGPSATGEGASGAGGARPGAGGVGREYRLEEVETPPKAVFKEAPRYPSGAAASGTGGVVRLTFLVGPDGAPSRISVLDASPPGVFEQSAVEAVARWRFSPGKIGGRPVPTWVVLPVRFEKR